MSVSLSRREFLKLGAAGMIGTAVTAGNFTSLSRIFKANNKRPNVLLIIMDTVRADHMSLYGYQKPTTPTIQQFARQGIVFTNAISPSSWTLPSHASIFTGKPPFDLSADWWTPLDSTYPTLAEVFRDEDYLTAGFIANFEYCSSEHGLDRGFTHYEDYRNSIDQTLLSSALIKRLAKSPKVFERYARHNNYGRKSAEQLVKDYLRWLREQGADENFFAFLNFYDAHDPYLPPEKYVHQYAPSRPEGFLHNDDATKVDPETIQEFQDSYDGAITYIDDQLGLLLADLSKAGVLDNTLVIITSDHGEQFGEHGRLGHGNSLYRPLIHVPLIMVWPDRISPNQVNDSPVGLINLASTIVDLLDLKTDVSFNGRSLFQTINSPQSKEPVLSQYDNISDNFAETGKGPCHSLVQDQWHYIRLPNQAEELYDYINDPGELTNLADTNSGNEVLNFFRSIL